MANFKPFECPSCGSDLMIPDDQEVLTCMYCGKKILVDKTKSGNKKNLIKAKPRVSYSLDNWNNKVGSLSLIDRNITSISEIIEWYSDDELSLIETLDLSSNPINDWGDLWRFNNLKYLYLDSMDLQTFDVNIPYHVKEVSLRSNQLTDLTHFDKIGKYEYFGNIISLDLSNNKFSSFQKIPRNIKKLNLSGNFLSDLNGINEFTNIEQLDISDNQITTIDGIEQLYNLTELNAENNKIKTIKALPQHLHSLNVSNNEIIEIDTLLANAINNIKIENESRLYFFFQGNPINNFSSFEKINFKKISDVNEVDIYLDLKEILDNNKLKKLFIKEDDRIKLKYFEKTSFFGNLEVQFALIVIVLFYSFLYWLSWKAFVIGVALFIFIMFIGLLSTKNKVVDRLFNKLFYIMIFTGVVSGLWFSWKYLFSWWVLPLIDAVLPLFR